MILDVIYAFLAFFATLSLIFILLILTQKRRHEHKEKKVNLARDYLFKRYIDKEEILMKVSQKFFFEAMIDVDEQIIIEKEVKDRIIEDLMGSSFVKRQIRKIKSPFKYKRTMAIYYLGRLKNKEIYQLLYDRFKKEKNEALRISLAYNLLPERNEEILSTIMDSLIGSSDIYHKRLCVIIGNRVNNISRIVQDYRSNYKYEIILGLARISEFKIDSELIKYLENILEWITLDKPYDEDKNHEIKRTILKNFLKFTPEILTNDFCQETEDQLIKEYSVMSIAKNPSYGCVDKLLASMKDENLTETVTKTLSRIVLDERQYLDHLLRVFINLNSYQKEKLIMVFANRVDYIILKLYPTNPKLLRMILDYIFNLRIIEPIIDFYNNNKDAEIEKYLNSISSFHLSVDSELTREFRAYLKPEILGKMGLQVLKIESAKKEKAPVEKAKVIWIIKWVGFAIILFPIIYLARMNVKLLDMTFKEIITRFMIDVNIYLIFYFVAINIIYIVLFVFALVGSKHQVNLAKTKKFSLLFADKLLPGVSIIAPAYNEEVSIIDSVTSLLNLKYPDYEVVVVNDGSKDNTLNKLIEHFELERKHPTHKEYLGTKKIRGIYRCKTIPNLVVVDKHNGGKADALNVGINVSEKPYVCGIDADSILEGDALLKLASVMLDDTKPFLAMGGNIYPANGFLFDRGQVEKRAIPKEMICRFQTIEYLRAFTSGRIGWSEIKSLMIISGAFGLFQKETLIRIGGYLTSSGRLKKDTVGEDMELVVRLSREALENKQKHRVSYVYNAYCYTELPSDIKTLSKQRNRWQRGLIDILSYHRKLAFKPRYKRIGFIGYPYFFLFEFLGPFAELIGYLMLILAVIFGLLNQVIILGIFTVSIAFGVVISLSSLFMSEREVMMMSRKETFILLFYAIFENFGYRQFISLHRVFSSISALKESGQWGAQKRKGFKT